jgi:hypothetical protein
MRNHRQKPEPTTCPNCSKELHQQAKPKKIKEPERKKARRIIVYQERIICPNCGQGCRMMIDYDGNITEHDCCHCSEKSAAE